MLHFAVSLGDAIDDMRSMRVFAALKKLASRQNATSMRAVLENADVLSHLAILG